MTDVASLGIRVTTTGAKEAARDLDKLSKEADRAETKALKLGKAWGLALGAGAAAVIVTGVKAIIRATIESERVQAQLEARVKSLGASSAASAKHINKLAESLQAASTFDDEAIKEAATSLLAFNNIRADSFDRALSAATDLAAATGDELAATADKVGKALNNPLTASRALREVGIELTASQKALIKELLQTNQVSEAQGIILTELEKRYQGAAQAARNTLGGAIQGLKNDFENLLEGDGNGVRGATDAINDLAEMMRSPAVRQGFSTIVDGLFDIIGAIVEAIPLIVDFNTKLGEAFGFSGSGGKRKGNAIDFFGGAADRLAALVKGDGETAEAAGKRMRAGFFGSDLPDFTNVTSKPAKVGADDDEPADRFKRTGGPLVGPAKPKKGRKPGKSDEEREAERLHNAFKSLEDSLKEQIALHGETTVAAQVRYDVENGELSKLSQGQKDVLLAMAAQRDAQIEAQKVAEEGKQLTESLLTPTEDLNRLRAEAAVLLEKGAISQKTYNAALEAYKDPGQQLLDDLQFELELLRMTNSERATAIQLRGLDSEQIAKYGNAIRAANDEIERQADITGDQIEAMDSIRDATKGFLEDVREGKNIWDSLGSAIDRVADKLFDLAAENLMDQIFGKSGTTGAGTSGGDWFSQIFGALFGGGGINAGSTTFVAKGGAFDDGQKIKAFARGGVFDSPTMFGMRDGNLGVMGEAGPEVVLPLHRGPDGKLGVRMAANNADRNESRQGDFHNTVIQQFNGQFTRRTAEQAARDQGRVARRGMARTGG